MNKRAPWWKFWPTSKKVVPTLRGLRILARADGSLLPLRAIYAWSHVVWRNRAWWALDEDGQIGREGGQRVKLSLPTDYANAVALHAQRRWFRNAFRSSSLTIRDAIPSSRLYGLMGVVCGLGLGILLSEGFLKAARFLRGEGWENLPPDYRWLAVAISVCMMLIYGCLVMIPTIAGMWLFLTSRPFQVEITNTRIVATMNDGRSYCYLWKDLTSVGRFGTVTFAGIHTLRLFGASTRTIVAIRGVAVSVLPSQIPRRVARPRAAPWRIVAWTVLGAALGYYLFKSFVEPIQHESDTRSAVLVVLVILALGLMHAVVASTLPTRFLRRDHRRARRKAHRSNRLTPMPR